jgi:hypothetical protein
MNGDSSEFEKELRAVINRHSAENFSNTPDFVLANFLLRCLDAWTAAVRARDSWFGFNPWSKGEVEV